MKNLEIVNSFGVGVKTYELTYIISSQISSQEADELKKDIETFILGKEGVILKSEKSTPKTLSYPIKKQSSGYFVNIEFQISEDKVRELKENLEKNSKILRHFIVVKKPMKQLKEMRTRRPLFMREKVGKPSFFRTAPLVKTTEKTSESKEEPVSMEDIDKKLDEILNE